MSVIPLRASPHPLPPAVLMRFATYEDDITLERRLEAKAIDPETHDPVVTLPLRAMSQWLTDNGYSWVTASSGMWRRQ